MVPINPLDAVEPALAHAAALARGGESTAAGRLLDDAHAYLALFTRPRYQEYDPAKTFEAAAARLTDARRGLDAEPVSLCLGDPPRVVDIVEAFVASAELDLDAVLMTEVFEEPKDGPCVALSFAGPGRVPEFVGFRGAFLMHRDEIERRWTHATRGGRIDPAPNGILLKLKGLRKPPEIPGGLDPILAHIEQARAAAEDNPKQFSSKAGACLALLEGPPQPPESAGLKALWAEALAPFKPVLAQRAIGVEALFDPAVPPMVLPRRPLWRLLGDLPRAALALFPRTGSLTLMAEYDAEARRVELSVELKGPPPVTPPKHNVQTLFASAFERSAAALGAELNLEAGPDGMRLNVALPDAAGTALDAWIPGFDALDARSVQMLRLLKSGGPCPPEALILAGVLEHELERWLLPRYDAPAVVNAAHEPPASGEGLPGSEPGRLKKALGQLQRGKPRKEIAAPAYAGEIAWAFRDTPRRRAMLGLEGLSEAELRAWCAALVAQPPDYAAALRVLARLNAVGRGDA